MIGASSTGALADGQTVVALLRGQFFLQREVRVWPEVLGPVFEIVRRGQRHAVYPGLAAGDAGQHQSQSGHTQTFVPKRGDHDNSRLRADPKSERTFAGWVH